MIQDIKDHTTHYAVLAAIFSVGLLAFLWVRTDAVLAIAMIGLTALAYFIWGVLHHHYLGDLTGKIVLEYLLFALLFGCLISGLLLQA